MTTPEPAPVILQTEEAVRAWIDGHAERHAKHPTGICACGWPGVVEELREAFAKSQGNKFHTWEDHARDTLIGDLGDVLPSDVSDKDADGNITPVPWRELVQRLSEQVARNESDLDPRFVDLMAWCVQQGHDVLTIANVTVLHPHYLARLLNVALPEQIEPEQPRTPQEQEATARA